MANTSYRCTCGACGKVFEKATQAKAEARIKLHVLTYHYGQRVEITTEQVLYKAKRRADGTWEWTKLG